MLGSSTVGRVASAALAIASLPMFASAHMFIASPSPIPGSCPKDPLEASGSNFPCHGVTLPSSGGQKMAAGSSQELSFALGGGANTAVHGGGSCQLSLLYDISKASDPSAWKVIYSIEGGCPANTVGNLATATQCTSADEGDCVHSFNYTIPAGVQSGSAILSWTWFNTVGNREMYQNCAAVDIEGGDGKEMDSLPAMYVANIAPSASCGMPESTNLGFPNPGSYKTIVTATNGKNYPVATPTAAGCGGGSAATPTGYGSGSGASSAAPSSSAYAAPTSAPAYSAPAPSSPDASGLPPAYVTSQPAQASSNDQPAATATTMMTVTASAPAAYTPPAAAPSADAPSGYSSGSSTNNVSSSSGISCSTDGAVVCIGSSQFGLCNAGTAVPQPLAPGTTCSNGVVSKKRAVRHAARHISGRRHSHKF